MIKNNMTPIDIFEAVVDFFKIHSENKKMDVQCDLGIETGPYFKESASDMCLLRTACLGNAERTIQGELLAFLRGKNIYATSEGGYRSPTPPNGDRHIDIMVHDIGSKIPLVAIELKHYSANQSSSVVLADGLKKDRKKIIGSHKTIQIGIYTSVENVSFSPNITPPNISPGHPIYYYRFLLAYALDKSLKFPRTKKN